MFFLMGVNDRIIALPSSCNLVCPACGRVVSFQITWIYHYIHFFFIPVFPFGHQYVATCGGCAAPFTVEVRTGHAFRRGQRVLTPRDLIPLGR